MFKLAANGDTDALNLASKILSSIDDPVNRRKLLYLRKSWRVVRADPCGENLCWLVSHVQSMLGRPISREEAYSYRNAFKSFCKALHESFDAKNFENLFLFERDSAGKVTGSLDGVSACGDYYEALFNRTKHCTKEGGLFELRLLATFLHADLHYHQLGNGGMSNELSLVTPQEQVSVVTPIGMKRGQAGCALHSQHQPTPAHFDSIFGVEGAFVAPTDSEETSPSKLLASALTRVETLAMLCSPGALRAALGVEITADHRPVSTRCAFTSGEGPSRGRKAPVSADGAASLGVVSPDSLVATVSAAVATALAQLLPTLLPQMLAQHLNSVRRPPEQHEGADSGLLPSSESPHVSAAAKADQVAALQRELDTASAAVKAASAATSGSLSPAASLSDARSNSLIGDSDSDVEPVVIGGGQSAPLPDADALRAQLDAAVSSLDKIFRGNDVCSAWVFDLGAKSLVGVEDRGEPIGQLKESLRPKFRDIIEAVSSTRTKKAKAVFGRLLAFIAGHVSDSHENGLQSSSQTGASRNFTFTPQQQRELLDLYVPLFQALFRSDTFTAEDADLRTRLLATYPGGSVYFNDTAASALLSVQRRQ